MKEFLSSYPLYQENLLLENYEIGNQNYTCPIDFIGETFEYWCEEEKSFKTFELDLEDVVRGYFGKMPGNTIPDECFIEEHLNYTFKTIGCCKSCNNYNIYLLLNVYSNKPISNIIDNIHNVSFHRRNTQQFPDTNIYIQKVGCFPKIKIIPNKIIGKYFDRESNTFYYKGLKAISQNFGVGALAYFRRIVEKELIHLIEDIKNLPDSHSSEIEILLAKHRESPKVSTIYENIFEHLPSSLKSLGENPIKLLYNQTSEGLHSLSEEDSLDKARLIQRLLEFVIKKIYEEKSEIKKLRDIIKELK
jgi:hypothetical protein